MKKEKINNPYSWDHINSEKYWEIYDILNDPDDNDMDKSAKLCCVIEGMDIEDFYNLPINEATEKINKLSFLNSFSLINHYTPKNLVIDGQKYNVMSDMSKFNVSQFIDYENFIQQPLRENYDKILSIFIIPDGCKYNDDSYIIEDIQKMIRERITFREVQSLLGFIMIEYIKSFLTSLQYSIKMVKKMKEGKEKEEMEKKINQLNKKIQDLMHFHF